MRRATQRKKEKKVTQIPIQLDIVINDMLLSKQLRIVHKSVLENRTNEMCL
jgi:hypothetical protein